jgi:hypothetical protein
LCSIFFKFSIDIIHQIVLHLNPSLFHTSKSPLVIRTDYSSDKTWKHIQKSILNPDSEYQLAPEVELINDISLKDASTQNIKDVISDYQHTFLAIADSTTMKSDPPLLLIVGCNDYKGLQFRCSSFELWFIDHNLSTGNLSFDEMKQSLDSSGLFSFPAFRSSQVSPKG